jgi:Holliday junction DNA helicase RuvB
MTLFEPDEPRADPAPFDPSAPLAARMRPRTLDEVVGQDHLLAPGSPLRRLVEGDAPMSLILFGPPGTGKTTLALIVSSATNRRFEQLSALNAGVKDVREVIARAKAELSRVGRQTVLFIDEIHRIARPAEELLYMAMEDFRVDVVVGKGPGATAIPLELAPFTLVGATTRAGLLTGPLRDRFGFTGHMDFYDPAELEHVLFRSAQLLGVALDADGAAEIAGRSRGTPRIANRLLRRVRDYAEVRSDGRVTADIAHAALAVYDVDQLGLDRLDRAVLDALVRRFGGGPVGVGTLAVAVGEEVETVEEVAEPFLVRAGLLARTPRGRVATPAAWEHLGLSGPRPAGPTLFDA